MTNNKRQNPKPFEPIKGEIYENAGGGQFLCDDKYPSSDSCWVTNIASGWHCLAKGIVRYDDGTIEWDRSTDGHFILLDEEKRETIYRASIRSRQRSLLNAMLCCMI